MIIRYFPTGQRFTALIHEPDAEPPLRVWVACQVVEPTPEEWDSPFGRDYLSMRERLENPGDYGPDWIFRMIQIEDVLGSVGLDAEYNPDNEQFFAPARDMAIEYVAGSRHMISMSVLELSPVIDNGEIGTTLTILPFDKEDR